MSSGVGAQERVGVVVAGIGEKKSDDCVLAWRERTWGLDAWVLSGFSPLPPSQPDYSVIPLTD